MSEEIEVGCLVKVHEGENFPCDLILVQSSLSKGISYVETKNLDGETNLKQKNAHEELIKYLESESGDEKDDHQKADEQKICQILQDSSINCEGPNEFLYRFVGNLLLKTG